MKIIDTIFMQRSSLIAFSADDLTLIREEWIEIRKKNLIEIAYKLQNNYIHKSIT